MTRTVIVVILSVCLVASGCSTTREFVTVAQEQDLRSIDLRKGDFVDVTMKSGEIRKLKLTAIDADSLTGLDRTQRNVSVQLAVADVESIEVRRTHVKGRTVAATLGIAAVVALAYAFIYYVACYGTKECVSD